MCISLLYIISSCEIASFYGNPSIASWSLNCCPLSVKSLLHIWSNITLCNNDHSFCLRNLVAPARSLVGYYIVVCWSQLGFSESTSVTHPFTSFMNLIWRQPRLFKSCKKWILCPGRWTKIRPFFIKHFYLLSGC